MESSKVADETAPESSSKSGTNDATASSSASDVFIRSLLAQVCTTDMEKLTQHQREALARFEKTNEMLIHCLSLSGSRLEAAKRELLWYTQMIVDMKKDLESIFRRIRTHKQNFSQLYPEAFAACTVEHIVPDDSTDSAVASSSSLSQATEQMESIRDKASTQ